MPSVNTRVFYSKTDRAKYISALDLNRCVLRAIRRSGLPVWQTEGFNPHTYVAFLLPLSLGQEGEREVMDFRLLEDIPPDEVTDRLNSALPPDIRVKNTAAPVHKGTETAFGDYRIEGDFDKEGFLGFTERESIPTEKKSKKGIITIDLKQYLYSAKIDGDAVVVRLHAGNDFCVNPALLFDAYANSEKNEVKRPRIVRTGIFLPDGSDFC